MAFSEDHKQLIRTVYIAYVTFHVFNLFFILHNISRYVIGLKMNRPLIVTFYVLILVGTLLRIIEYSLRLMQ